MIDIYHILLGCTLGVFAGLLPGLGYFTTLLLVFPLLLDMTVLELLVVYSAVVTISIYVGSIPATIYGIPGDSSSLPCVYESRNLNSQIQVSQAISGAAFGGFFGSVSVALLCFVLLEYLENIKYFYSTGPFVLLLICTSFIVIYTSGDSKIISSLLYVFGFFLGSIGYNDHLDTSIFVLNNYMYSGLPSIVVISALFAVPNILYFWQNFSNHKKIDTSKENFNIYRPYMLSPVKTMFFTFVGFFTGMVPSLSTILSSNLAHNIMSMFSKDPVKRITASETANNAGAFSMLLPLLIFGIPITSSEALLLFFLEQSGFNTYNTTLAPLMSSLIWNYLVINLIGLLLAWPLAKYVKYFYNIDLRYLFTGVIAIIVATVIYSGLEYYSVWWYITLFLVLLPIGVMLRRFNLIPLVFAFFISKILLSKSVILYDLYF